MRSQVLVFRGISCSATGGRAGSTIYFGNGILKAGTGRTGSFVEQVARKYKNRLKVVLGMY